MMLTIKGMAASMASYIAVNPAWDLIAAEDNAVFMIHNAWGGVVGDYREVGKMAEILDGLTNLIGKAYAIKAKKSLTDIRALMDDETWYFGDEILKAGFVDEIVKTETPKDKSSAVAASKLKFSALTQKLQAMSKSDITQIAAMIKPDTNTGTTPADAGKNKLEVNAMTLVEFLAQNPTAQIEYNAAIEDHGKTRFDAGVKSVQDRIAGVLPFLKPESVYPGPIKALAVDCIDGKVDAASLRAAVATFDALNEKKKSDAAIDETGEQGNTHGQQTPQPSTDGIVKNEIDFKAMADAAKSKKGMEV